MEKPIYPSPYMRITQKHNVGSHIDSYAIDDAGSDGGIDYIVAPFTGIIKKIYTNDANEVWLESVDKVEYPDGTIDYMTVLFAHANTVDSLFIGKKINRKEKFYFEGTKGQATGNHCHIECGRGKFTGSGWHDNGKGYWVINNGKNVQDCFWIDDSIKILDSSIYNFKKISESINDEVDTDNKKEDSTIDDNTSNPNQETPTNSSKDTDEQSETIDDTTSSITNKNLIFTCTKEDTYALKLKKGDCLYLTRKN